MWRNYIKLNPIKLVINEFKGGCNQELWNYFSEIIFHFTKSLVVSAGLEREKVIIKLVRKEGGALFRMF